MPFTVEHTPLPGLLVIRPAVFGDARGWFYESFSAQRYAGHGVPASFVQDNFSQSFRGAVRGLHFQAPPHAQAKLVSVVHGQVLDVVVDVRPASPTYGQHYSILLDGDTKTQLYIPEGFAHGFATLSEQALFHYKCSGYYHKASEGGIRWNDPTLNIAWGVDSPIVSEKDEQLPLWVDFKSPF